jgi:hypothetical protein
MCRGRSPAKAVATQKSYFRASTITSAFMSDLISHLIPSIRQTLAKSVEAFLVSEYAMRRPPIVTSETLALAIELDRLGRAFPSNTAVARALGASSAGIQVALTAARDRGLIIEQKAKACASSAQRVACSLLSPK